MRITTTCEGWWELLLGYWGHSRRLYWTYGHHQDEVQKLKSLEEEIFSADYTA